MQQQEAESRQPLSDRELAIWLQQQEPGSRQDWRYDYEASASSSSSSSRGAAATSWPTRLVLRALGPSGGRHVHCPFLTDVGCFGAALGCFGGCVTWIIGHAQCMCLCIAAGALSEEAVRRAQSRAQYRDMRRRWSSSDEDTSSDEYDAPRGLDPEAIERSTVVTTANPKTAVGKVARGGGALEEHCKCMICVELFCKGDSLRTLPCLHRYHRSCIDEWLRRSCLCPICKHDVTETSPRRERPQGSRVRALSGGLPAVTRLRRRPWRRSSVPRLSTTSGSGSFREALERASR